MPTYKNCKLIDDHGVVIDNLLVYYEPPAMTVLTPARDDYWGGTILTAPFAVKESTYYNLFMEDFQGSRIKTQRRPSGRDSIAFDGIGDSPRLDTRHSTELESRLKSIDESKLTDTEIKLRKKWEELVSALSERDRQVFNMRLEGREFSEIAEHLDIDVNVARSVIQQLISHLDSVGENWRQVENWITEQRTLSLEDEEIQVFIDPGNSSPELVAEFYTALSALYRSCGGSGLEIVKEERRSFAGEML